MGSGFSKMKKQARLMQQQMQEMRGALQSKEILGEKTFAAMMSETLCGDMRM